MQHQRVFTWITALACTALTLACSEEEPMAQLPAFERPACLLLSEEEAFGRQPIERSTYQYDEQGRITGFINDNMDDTPFDTTIFHFDKEQWVGSTIIQNGSDDAYIRTLKLQNIYENARLVSQQYRREDEPTVIFKTTYSYDEQGYVNRFETYNADQSKVLQLTGYIIYTRTSEGNIQQEKEYELDPGTDREEPEHYRTITYAYDEHPTPFDTRVLVANGVHESINNVTSEIGEYADGRTYQKTFSYTYNEKGYPLTAKQYSADMVEPSTTITYTYDCQ